ncbi:unnamed protein product, partial [Adineta steineri]
MEKALPMFVLGISCIFITAVVFELSLDQIEKIQHENEEKKDEYPIYIVHLRSQKSLEFPISTINNKI